MDEAEHTLVGARRDVTRLRCDQLEAEVAALARHVNAAGPGVTLDRQPEPVVGGVELEVDRVAERRAVDGEDPVPSAEPGNGGR